MIPFFLLQIWLFNQRVHKGGWEGGATLSPTPDILTFYLLEPLLNPSILDQNILNFGIHLLLIGLSWPLHCVIIYVIQDFPCKNAKESIFMA